MTGLPQSRFDVLPDLRIERPDLTLDLSHDG
jgi:hypothetical protein